MAAPPRGVRGIGRHARGQLRRRAAQTSDRASGRRERAGAGSAPAVDPSREGRCGARTGTEDRSIESPPTLSRGGGMPDLRRLVLLRRAGWSRLPAAQVLRRCLPRRVDPPHSEKNLGAPDPRGAAVSAVSEILPRARQALPRPDAARHTPHRPDADAPTSNAVPRVRFAVFALWEDSMVSGWREGRNA